MQFPYLPYFIYLIIVMLVHLVYVLLVYLLLKISFNHSEVKKGYSKIVVLTDKMTTIFKNLIAKE